MQGRAKRFQKQTHTRISIGPWPTLRHQVQTESECQAAMRAPPLRVAATHLKTRLVEPRRSIRASVAPAWRLSRSPRHSGCMRSPCEAEGSRCRQREWHHTSRTPGHHRLSRARISSTTPFCSTARGSHGPETESKPNGENLPPTWLQHRGFSQDEQMSLRDTVDYALGMLWCLSPGSLRTRPIESPSPLKESLAVEIALLREVMPIPTLRSRSAWIPTCSRHMAMGTLPPDTTGRKGGSFSLPRFLAPAWSPLLTLHRLATGALQWGAVAKDEGIFGTQDYL